MYLSIKYDGTALENGVVIERERVCEKESNDTVW